MIDRETMIKEILENAKQYENINIEEFKEELKYIPIEGIRYAYLLMKLNSTIRNEE